MADRIELHVGNTLARLVPHGSVVLAAVSGGGDSVALLHLLWRWARRGRFGLAVAHLDHGLRRGSRADRRFVERLAAELELPCFAERRDVPALRRDDESPEEAARRVRRAFLIETAGTAGAAWVATGHTLDDQAETILMRLARGAGTRALAGMAERGPGPFVRPLLELERHELRAWLERRGHEFREDPSNRDLRFDRNRARRLVLPLLAEQLNPRAARHLVAAARRIREDALYLDEIAEALARRLLDADARGRQVLDAAGLRAAPPVLARRVVRIALERAGADLRRVGSRHLESVMALAGPRGSGEAHLPGGLSARRSRSRIAIGRD